MNPFPRRIRKLSTDNIVGEIVVCTVGPRRRIPLKERSRREFGNTKDEKTGIGSCKRGKRERQREKDTEISLEQKSRASELYRI